MKKILAMVSVMCLCLLLLPGLALAQTPATPAPPIDYAGLAGSMRTEVTNGLGAYLPVLLGLGAGVIGVSMLWKWGKKFVKSS